MKTQADFEGRAGAEALRGALWSLLGVVILVMLVAGIGLGHFQCGAVSCSDLVMAEGAEGLLRTFTTSVPAMVLAVAFLAAEGKSLQHFIRASRLRKGSAA